MALDLAKHSTAAELLQLSKNAANVRVSHRLLAIRDLLLGETKTAVRTRYGISHDTLWRWVCDYNTHGAEGLEDAPRPGRPIRLDPSKHAGFKQRVVAQPTYETDGVVRWRAQDIQALLQKEYGVKYQSLSGVRRLCHALDLSYLTTRPSHPKRNEEAIATFKKTPGNTRGNPTKTPR